eukprot:RCo044049
MNSPTGTLASPAPEMYRSDLSSQHGAVYSDSMAMMERLRASISTITQQVDDGVASPAFSVNEGHSLAQYLPGAVHNGQWVQLDHSDVYTRPSVDQRLSPQGVMVRISPVIPSVAPQSHDREQLSVSMAEVEDAHARLTAGYSAALAEAEFAKG